MGHRLKGISIFIRVMDCPLPTFHLVGRMEVKRGVGERDNWVLTDRICHQTRLEIEWIQLIFRFNSVPGS